MGARNVSHVYTNYPALPDPALRVITQLALVAHDNDKGERPRGTYFGGEELLARVVGKGSVTDSSRRSARRALKLLVDLKVLERVVAGRRGSRAEYRMTYTTTLPPARGVRGATQFETDCWVPEVTQSDSESRVAATPLTAADSRVVHATQPDELGGRSDTRWEGLGDPDRRVWRVRIGGSGSSPPGETEEKQRNTGRKNTRVGEHVPSVIRGLGPRVDGFSGDEDDDSAADRAALGALGVDVYPALIERAQGEGLTGVAMVRRALDLARATKGQAS